MTSLFPSRSVPFAIAIFSRVILAFTVSGLLTARGDDLPVPPRREQVETMVKTTLKAWETGDEEVFAAALHDQLLFAYPGDRLNRTELLDLFKSYHQEKQDIKIYFGRFFVDGNQFALSYQFAATDRKTGKRQAVGTGVVGRIEDGKIILLKEYYDEHVARRQAAGEIPLDEGKVFPYPASIELVPALIN